MNTFSAMVRLLGAALSMCCAASVCAQQDPSPEPAPSSSKASGQGYPNRPTRLIVPYAPGGSTSWTSRLVGDRLMSVGGHPVIIDNRPGASTVIGTEAGVKAKPDGYTLFYIGGQLSTNYW